jgi:uncharacterized membrane protein YsdA (DUF1294 family)
MKTNIFTIIYIAALVLFNFVGYLIVKVDKKKEAKNERPINGTTYFALGALGGSLGIYFSMFINRYKIEEAKYCVGILLLLIINIATAFLILFPFVLLPVAPV